LCDSYKVSATVKFFATPTNIVADNAASSIKVTWTAVKGATVYRVYRKLVGEDSWTYIGNTKTNSYVDKKVTGADNYAYTVKAGDGKAYSSYDKTGATLVRLEAPKLTKAVSSKEGITVTINKVDGAKGYYVYRKTANTSWVRIGTVNSARSNGYLDKSTKKGVTYTYTIRAFNGNSRSSYDTKGIAVKDVH
jgi:fibronectin type 3 domain-containing protein